MKLAGLGTNPTTRLKDSQDLLQQLVNLEYLSPGAQLLTANARAIYTNIDTVQGIEAISRWIFQYKNKLSDDFWPLELIIEILTIIMTESFLSLVIPSGNRW